MNVGGFGGRRPTGHRLQGTSDGREGQSRSLAAVPDYYRLQLIRCLGSWNISGSHQGLCLSEFLCYSLPITENTSDHPGKTVAKALG